MAHVWRKSVTNDTEKPKVVRAWSCACGATKRRVSRRAADYPNSPATTVERVVSQDSCTSERVK